MNVMVTAAFIPANNGTNNFIVVQTVQAAMISISSVIAVSRSRRSPFNSSGDNIRILGVVAWVVLVHNMVFYEQGH